jgi:hypothetical protein
MKNFIRKKLIIESIYNGIEYQKNILNYVNNRLKGYNETTIKLKTMQNNLAVLKAEYNIKCSNGIYSFVSDEVEEKALKDYNILSIDEKLFVPMFTSILKHYSSLPFIDKITKVLKNEFLLKDKNLKSSENFKFIDFNLNLKKDQINELRNRTSVLLKAIENKKYVNFFYTPVSKSKYVLKRDQIPLKVSLKDGFYYLTCTKDGLKDKDIRLKSYRIDLISDLVVHKEIYAIGETTKDELKFTEDYSPGVFTVNKIKHEKKYLFFRFTNWAAAYVNGVKIHHSQEIIDKKKSDKERDCIVRFCMAVLKNKNPFILDNNKEIAFLFSRFGEYCELIHVNDNAKYNPAEY